MRTARQQRRDAQIQARKALRHELRDPAINAYLRERIEGAHAMGVRHGAQLMLDRIVTAAFHLTYEEDPCPKAVNTTDA